MCACVCWGRCPESGTAVAVADHQMRKCPDRPHSGCQWQPECADAKCSERKVARVCNSVWQPPTSMRTTRLAPLLRERSLQKRTQPGMTQKGTCGFASLFILCSFGDDGGCLGCPLPCSLLLCSSGDELGGSCVWDTSTFFVQVRVDHDASNIKLKATRKGHGSWRA